MTMPPWKPSGARSNAKPWPQAPPGLRTECVANSSSISKAITTGAGSTALWAINHLWTSKTKTVNNEKDSSTQCTKNCQQEENVKKTSQKKGGKGKKKGGENPPPPPGGGARGEGEPLLSLRDT